MYICIYVCACSSESTVCEYTSIMYYIHAYMLTVYRWYVPGYNRALTYFKFFPKVTLLTSYHLFSTLYWSFERMERNPVAYIF